MKAPLAKGRLFAILAATSAAVAACSGSGAAPVGSASASHSATPSVATAAPSVAVATAPPATASPTAAPTADVASEICDPWLTADAVATVAGKPPLAAIGQVNPSVNEWPGPLSCQWNYPDGLVIRFTAGYDQGLRPVLFMEGKDVSGLGDQAAFAPFGHPNAVVWGQGSDPALIMTVDSRQLDEDQVVSLARAVTVPSPQP